MGKYKINIHSGELDRILNGHTFNVSAVAIANGEELQLFRFTVPSGKKIRIWGGGLTNLSGNQVTNAKIQIYNEDDTQEEWSTNSVITIGNPLATLALAGKDISIKIKNDSGSIENLHGFVTISIES